MKKSTIVVIIVAILVIAAVIYYNVTGKVVTFGGSLGKCTDTDGGDDQYVKGTASYSNRDYKYTDTCYWRGKKLKEYYCTLEDFRIKTKRYVCANGCVDGACLKETAS